MGHVPITNQLQAMQHVHYYNCKAYVHILHSIYPSNYHDQAELSISEELEISPANKVYTMTPRFISKSNVFHHQQFITYFT